MPCARRPAPAPPRRTLRLALGFSTAAPAACEREGAFTSSALRAALGLPSGHAGCGVLTQAWFGHGSLTHPLSAVLQNLSTRQDVPLVVWVLLRETQR